MYPFCAKREKYSAETEYAKKLAKTCCLVIQNQAKIFSKHTKNGS